MPRQSIFRCIAAISLAIALLAGFVLILRQAANALAETGVDASARSTAGTDWTVGGPCGATIQACIDNPGVVDGDRILIPAGRYTESFTLGKAASLIGADANTTVIHAVSGQRALTITGSVITASTVISALTFTGGSFSGIVCQAACGGGILITGTARPLIENTAIISNQAWRGGGIYVHAGSPISLTNINVLSNSAVSEGGGVCTADVAVLIDSRVENNVAQAWGGGLLALDALELINVQVISNTAGNSILAGVGGGLGSDHALTITGSLFERNRSVGFGGVGGSGLIAYGTLFMTDTVFISNTADMGGAGAWLYDPATVVNSRFESNSTYGYGGGVFTFASLLLTDTEFISNTALRGGGLYNDLGVFTRISGGQFRGNLASNLGGGAFTVSPLTISGTEIINNVAASDGGGLFAYEINATGVRFAGNVSQSGNGGGLYTYGPANLMRTVFINNSAALNGGGADFSGQRARIANAILANNSAGGDGASISLHHTVVTPGTFVHVTIADSGLNPSAAIAVFSGTLAITNSIIASHTIGISNTGGTVYQDYNLFSGNVLSQTGTVAGGGHSFNGNPAFVSPASGDYHILFTSATLDRGIDAGVATDIDGDARPHGSGFDIGADEYTGLIVSIYLPLVLKN